MIVLYKNHKEKHQLQCDICNIQFNSIQTFKKHLICSTHKMIKDLFEFYKKSININLKKKFY